MAMQSIRICPSFPRLNILSLPGLVGPEGSLRPCLLAQDRVHTNTQEVVVQWKCFPECSGTLGQAGSVDVEMTTGKMLPCQDARGLWKQGDDIITAEQSIPTFPLPRFKARRWAETEAFDLFSLWISVVGSQIVAATEIHTPIRASVVSFDTRFTYL